MAASDVTSGFYLIDPVVQIIIVSGHQSSQNLTVLICVLQLRLPQARVLYVSATGATEVEHMACFVRLGLWGPHTAFATRFLLPTNANSRLVHDQFLRQ